MTSTRYQITITGSNGVAPGDGFIDNISVNEYISAGNEPATLAASTAKSRGNARFRYIIAALHSMTNVYVSDIVTTGATIGTAPSSITFVALVEQGDTNLRTNDENNVGQILNGIPAITRVIGRVLSAPPPSDIAEIYDPTQTSAVNAAGASVPFPRFGVRVTNLSTGPVAASLAAGEAMVTATPL